MAVFNSLKMSLQPEGDQVRNLVAYVRGLEDGVKKLEEARTSRLMVPRSWTKDDDSNTPC